MASTWRLGIDHLRCGGIQAHRGADDSQIGTVKLFNKWSYEDVEVKDISLT